jgi:hypothetical protein
MKLFNRKIENNNLLKLYQPVSQSQAEHFDTKSLIYFILSEFKTLPVKLNNFYITGPYPNDGWKTERGFLNGIEKEDYKNIHHLLISDSENKLLLSFTNWAHNFTIPIKFATIDFELMSDEHLVTKEYLCSLAEKLYNYLPFEYGFVFSQSKTFSISEGKIKKGLGSYTEKENIAYKKWIQYNASIKDGFIRKIYHYNFLSERQLEGDLFIELIRQRNIGTLRKFKSIGLWTIDTLDMNTVIEVASKSELVIENENFNNTRIKKEIDQEIEKIRMSWLSKKRD